jgi:hypothetical protein
VADREAWTAFPEQARRYRLRDRWSDFRMGRADAKAGIPRMPVALVPPQTQPPRSVDAPSIPDASALHSAPSDMSELTIAQQAPAEPVTSSLSTPYLAGLRHARNLHIAAELKQYQSACGQLREHQFSAQNRREFAATTLNHTTARHTDLDRELTADELSRRGLAEQDTQRWPAERLRERRQRAHRLARSQAAEELKAATIGLRTAELAVEQARARIDQQFRLAQATGWQIAHHYGRREATYVRALTRKHKNGPALVELFELAGPVLPDWLLKADAAVEGS